MSKKTKVVGILLAWSLLPIGVMAQFSANVGVVSDYVWRGVSQTQEDPALQGGVDVNCPLGFYAGVWGSNVEFDDTTDMEVDGYLGYAKELDNGFKFDIGYVRYHYSDFDDADDAYLGVSYASLELKYSRGFEIDWNYVECNLTFDMPSEFALGLHAGSYTFDEGTDYVDFKLGISRSLLGLDVELAWTDTNLDDPSADSRVYLGILKTW